MPRERVALTVLVDLDPIPGGFHTPEQARDAIDALLLSRIGHYSPVVIINKD